ncbi:hypothetical protein D3C80_1964650 [compost metagenome]
MLTLDHSLARIDRRHPNMIFFFDIWKVTTKFPLIVMYVMHVPVQIPAFGDMMPSFINHQAVKLFLFRSITVREAE